VIVREFLGFRRYILVLFCVLVASSGLAAQEQIVLDREKVMREQQENTEYLLAQAIKKAKELMERNGDFLPFGAALFGSGDVRFVWTQNPDEPAKVSPAIALAAVKRGLQANAQRGRILGAASVYRYTPADDEGKPLEAQINVEVEYISGYAFVVAFDYTYEDGEFTAGKGVRREIPAALFKGAPDGEVVPKSTESEPQE
jgi:hypothetical protein